MILRKVITNAGIRQCQSPNKKRRPRKQTEPPHFYYFCCLSLTLRFVVRFFRSIVGSVRVAVSFTGVLPAVFVVTLSVEFRRRTMRLGGVFVVLCCFFVRMFCHYYFSSVCIETLCLESVASETKVP